MARTTSIKIVSLLLMLAGLMQCDGRIALAQSTGDRNNNSFFITTL